jgi:hypothetical protein
VKRLDTLLLLILLLGSFNGAHAQSLCNTQWCITTINVSPSTFAVGGQTTIQVSVQAVAAAANEVIDIEIYDSTKNRVSQSWQPGYNFAAGQIQNAMVVSFATVIPGTYTVAVGTFSPTANDPANLFDGSAQTFSVTGTMPFVPYVPPCLPKRQFPVLERHGSIPIQVPPISTRYTIWSVWVCGLPGGYVTYPSLGTSDPSTLGAVTEWVLGTRTLAIAQADCLATCVPATDSETAYLLTLREQYRPRAVVMLNGLNKTRPVYTTKADGTLNGTPVAGSSIPVATACDETTRIPTSQTFYSVAGKNDQNGHPLPAGTYTQCGVTFPLGAN